MIWISDTVWDTYISGLRKVNQKAAKEMFNYLATHDWAVSKASKQAAIDYAFALATKYGEAASTLACEMYDSIMMASGYPVYEAVPAETATISEVAKTINGTAKTGNIEIMASAVGRLVKLAAADTTLQNAVRDGAEFAWIPRGDTCAFCLTLASRGWQRVSKKTIRNGHAEHIHANCDCMYAVRMDSNTDVEGYNPEKYKRIYYGADGKTPNEKINSIRRAQHAELKKQEDDAKLILQAIVDQKVGNESNILVDALIDNHYGLKNISPTEMKNQLEKNGFDVKPLGNRSRLFPGVLFENGGGFRVVFGGDGNLRYHPPGGLHKAEYWTVSNGERGKHQYDMDGEEIFF